jgi:outer membrane protein assembly factor BamB
MYQRCVPGPFAFGALLLSVLPVAALAGGPAWWPQWRGLCGQGHSEDVRAPLSWSEKENVLWKVSLPGIGNSTPVVWGDRLYLTASSNDGRERYVLAIRTSDGKVLWKQTASTGDDPGRTHEWNGFASASCAIDGERVYAFFGTPGLFCYDRDGRLLWQHFFGTFTSERGWGTAASPMLFEDLVIQNCDNDGQNFLPKGSKGEAAPMALVALDKKTGEVRWTTSRNQGRGFSTPRLITVEGGRVDLVLNGPNGLWGYDPHSGKELWRCTRFAPNEQHKFGEPMPVDDGRTLFVSSGRPGPCQALRMPDKGDVTTSHVIWQAERKNHRDVGSPILWGGRIYAADSKGMLSCLDLATGRELYLQRLGPGKAVASPVALRGKLLFLLDDGVTVVVEPGDIFKVLHRNRLGSGQALDFNASPAIADGRLFLRSQSTLYCIAEK